MPDGSLRARLGRWIAAGDLPRQLERRYGVPLIVIGMHRSGTSLVTRLLRACGGYFGSDLEGNSEPLQMIRINDVLLESWGASWRRFPPDFEARRRSGHARAVRAVRRRLDGMHRSLFEHFGAEAEEGKPDGTRLRARRFPAMVLPGSPPQRRVQLWGWKDPRNTLTLPVWLELFPAARVLHVVRSGVDVALSLHARAHSRGVGVPECLDAGYCFDLWERYLADAQRWRALPSSRYFELCYEDLLEDPRAALPPLLRFAGGEVERAESPDVLAQCKLPSARDRSAHPELLARAKQSARFRELGYSL